MNTKLIFLLAILVLGLAAAALLLTGPAEQPAPATPPPAATSATVAAPSSSNFDFGPSGASSGTAASAPTPSTEPFEATPDQHGLIPLVDNEEDLKRSQINDKILEAVVTYAPEGVPVIKPYLTDKDPLIREAAISGMMQIGVPEAAEALREASKRPGLSNKERLQMLEAADFVELPPFEFPAGAATRGQAAPAAAAPAPASAPAAPTAP